MDWLQALQWEGEGSVVASFAVWFPFVVRDTLTWNFKRAAWVWLCGRPAVCLVSGSCHIAGS